MKKFAIRTYHDVYTKSGLVKKSFTRPQLYDTKEQALDVLRKVSGLWKSYKVEYNEDLNEGTIYKFNFNDVPFHETFKIVTKNVKIG